MKNGFTLIELLAVIVILAVILLITVISVDSTLLTSKKNVSSLQQKNIEEAAKTYYLKEGMQFEDDCISVSRLLNKGYLEGEKVKNPETKEDMNGYVKITYANNQYSYKYQKDNCEIYESIKNPEVGVSPQIKNGNIVPGSAFKIKVNNTFEPLTFFVLSNEGEYVNLIAEQNIAPDGKFTSELQDNDYWYITPEGSYYNTSGPKVAYEYLKNATDKWTNIPIIKDFNFENLAYKESNTYGYKGIVTSLDNSSGKYITTILTNPSTGETKITYENLRARFPSKQEVVDNTSCTSTNGSCPLWMVNYLAKSTYYTSELKKNSTGSNYGYWLLDTLKNSNGYIELIYFDGSIFANYHSSPNYGIRPVISIPKNLLLSEIK